MNVAFVRDRQAASHGGPAIERREMNASLAVRAGNRIKDAKNMQINMMAGNKN
ncbi:hypothetical protein [Burkholderia sp. MSMB1498]|nr:hypothetical protein [Burkholderia sp. MSMB1498]